VGFLYQSCHLEVLPKDVKSLSQERSCSQVQAIQTFKLLMRSCDSIFVCVNLSQGVSI
jgi:hypothetical protein